VTYELLPPASDLEKSEATIINNGQPIRNPDIHIASHHKFAVSLTVEHTKKQSAVYIREYVPEDDLRYKPGTLLQEIALKGGPQLFTGFDIPSTFPPLSSYTETSITYDPQTKREEKIDKVSVCTNN
jgi:hypothetical protein